MLLDKIQEVLQEHKAQDVCVIDLPDFAFASHMIVATGTSSRHLWTLGDKLRKSVRDLGLRANVEGDADSDWIVLDVGGIVIHFFTAEKRAIYDIEGLWLHGMSEDVAGDECLEKNS